MVINSKKEIESKINEAMVKFLKEQMGERHLSQDPEGARLINELKGKLIEKAKPLLEPLIGILTQAEVVDIHSSFNAATGERIEIFTLNKDLEKSFPAVKS